MRVLTLIFVEAPDIDILATLMGMYGPLIGVGCWYLCGLVLVVVHVGFLYTISLVIEFA